MQLANMTISPTHIAPVGGTDGLWFAVGCATETKSELLSRIEDPGKGYTHCHRHPRRAPPPRHLTFTAPVGGPTPFWTLNGLQLRRVTSNDEDSSRDQVELAPRARNICAVFHL